MEKRKLGRVGPEVSAIGLGCMSLSGVYGTSDDEAGIRLIHRAIEIGVDHFDSSDMYGWGQNEELLGRALKGRRDGIVIASKFGQTRRPGLTAGSARPPGSAAGQPAVSVCPRSPAGKVWPSGGRPAGQRDQGGVHPA